MSEKASVQIVVRSKFPFAVESITLCHRYGNESNEDVITWGRTSPGQVTSPSLTANYWTGFIEAGTDHWSISVTLPGGILWESGWNDCMLFASDRNKTLTFEVDAGYFHVDIPSGGNFFRMSGQEYYHVAAVKIVNEFPVDAQVVVKHTCGRDLPVFEQKFDRIPASTKSAELMIVQFNPVRGYPFGKVPDYWNLDIKLDIRPYDNEEVEAFKSWANEIPDTVANLFQDDNNTLRSIRINGKGLYFDFAKHAEAGIRTPNGYQSTAFFQVKNGFSQSIRKLGLWHQFGSDAKYEQSCGLISPGQTSRIMFAEFNTGIFTPFDYWNVHAVLEDGRIFGNSKLDKECYLTLDDLGKVLEFSVSDSNFHIGLKSGACNDGMKYIGIEDLTLGIDPSKRYDENAYLTAHNAFSNFSTGFYYAQQSRGLLDQLASGVTCLLLDIWDYKGDVSLIHETAWAQPFVRPETLKDGLEMVAMFLDNVPHVVLTIVFEDKVEQNRSKIETAFRSVRLSDGRSLWDTVFFPDQTAEGRNAQWFEWPTLDWMIQKKQRLVVFTSSDKGPFPYQWDYMSENVYGDASLDPKTWLDKRDESEPLSQLELCALNHFPRFAPTIFNNWLSDWLSEVRTVNSRATALKMFAECKACWGRYPNYWQVDFFEIPNDEPASAVLYLNALLHGVSPVDKDETSEYAQRLKLLRGPRPDRIFSAWRDAAKWISVHRPEIVQIKGNEQKLPAQELLQHQITSSGNLAVLLYGLSTASGRESSENEKEISAWASRHADELASWYRAMLAKTDLKTMFLQGKTIDPGWLLPILLMSETTQELEGCLTEIKSLMGKPGLNPSEVPGNDALFAADLLGLVPSASAVWGERIRALLDGANEKPWTSGSLYNLAHQILYATRFGRRDLTELLFVDAVILLRKILAEQATLYLRAGNGDLASELIAAYVGAGGDAADGRIASAAVILASQGFPSSDRFPDTCRAPMIRSDAPGIDAPRIDQHEVLVRMLALGMIVRFSRRKMV